MANLIGQQFGQYTLTALLGEGGMAAVYRARQASMQRDVAVKVIKSNLLEMSEFVQRFEREARTVATLSHPHILKVFDYGQQDSNVYLVMELLTGGSLVDLVRRGTLPMKSTFRIVSQIASALDYAHQKGIVHRDLKPQNVLLDENQNAFLTDFGIAKLLNASVSLTNSGTAIGTPAYMSPEQWEGSAVDGRADIYALGVMLFEMLTGHAPFKADTPMSMMYMHLNAPPPSVRAARPQLPEAVEQVVSRALAKQPDQRFSSAGEMVNALREAMVSSAPAAPISAAQSVASSPTKETPGRKTQIVDNGQPQAASTATPVVTQPPAQKLAPGGKQNASTSPFLLVGVVALVLIIGAGLILAFSRQRTFDPVVTPTAALAAAQVTEASSTPGTVTPYAATGTPSPDGSANVAGPTLPPTWTPTWTPAVSDTLSPRATTAGGVIRGTLASALGVSPLRTVPPAADTAGQPVIGRIIPPGAPLGANIAVKGSIADHFGGITDASWNNANDATDYNTTTRTSGGRWANSTNQGNGSFEVVDLGREYQIGLVGYHIDWEGTYQNPLTVEVAVMTFAGKWKVVSSVAHPATGTTGLHVVDVNVAIDLTAARFVRFMEPPDGSWNGRGDFIQLRVMLPPGAPPPPPPR